MLGYIRGNTSDFCRKQRNNNTVSKFKYGESNFYVAHNLRFFTGKETKVKLNTT